MHMSDALLSPAVGLAMCAASVGAIAYSAAKIEKDELSEKKIPIMAVSGAFVFAAQMLNFTIPGTGSSGHIGGGVLLASMLGGYPAMLTLSAVLIIQCLFFADGGLLALGCNIFNMGVIPCLIIYPLIYKPILRKGITVRRLSAACMISAIVGLQLGALGVVVETTASGISELPFGAFAALIQPIHLAIGIIEGIVTAAIVSFVYRMRPELAESALSSTGLNADIAVKKVVAVIAVLAVITGGVLALYASPHPDGLEWAIVKTAGGAEIESSEPLIRGADRIQSATAFMPDYEYGDKDGETGGTSVAGLVGGAMTFALAGLTGFLIKRVKKKKNSQAA